MAEHNDARDALVTVLAPAGSLKVSPLDALKPRDEVTAEHS